MTFDVHAARSAFPALAEGLAHFDCPGGTQVPSAVSDAVAEVMRSAVSNRHGPFPAAAGRTRSPTRRARPWPNLVGGDPSGVVLGPSMTSNTYVLACALAKTWAPGDEVC